MAERIPPLEKKKKGRDEDNESSSGKQRPAGRQTKAEKLAAQKAKREFGGIPPSEIAVPVEAPVSESVVEQAPVVEEAPMQSGEVIPAAEPVAESAPQEPATTEVIAPVVEQSAESGVPGPLIQKFEEWQASVEAPLARSKTKESKSPGVLDPDRMTYLSELAYKDIADEVRKVGVNPSDLPAEVWEPANKAFGDLRNLIAAQKNEPELLGKKKIDAKMRALRSDLKGVIRSDIKFAAQEHLKTHPVQAETTKAGPATSAEAAEPTPDIPPIAQVLEGLGQESVDRNIALEEASPKEEESLPSPKIVANREDAADQGHMRELFGDTDESMVERPDGWKTPAELWKELRTVVAQGAGKLYEVGGKAAEKTKEQFTKSREYLNERAKELDAKAEMSGLEKWTRTIGEKYNKLSAIKKLGIGVTLGVGTAVGAAFSLPLALAGVSGLVLQRAAGAASMFVSLEKKLQEKKVGESHQWMAVKERAALDAMLYTAVMGTVISKGLELARDYDVVEKTREWLGVMLGHPTQPPVVVESITAATNEGVGAAFPPSEAAPSPAPVHELPPSVRGFQGQVRAEASEMASSPAPTPEAPIVHVPVQHVVSAEVPTAAPEAVTTAPEVIAPEASAPESVSGSEITTGPNANIEGETRQNALNFVTHPTAPAEALTPEAASPTVPESAPLPAEGYQLPPTEGTPPPPDYIPPAVESAPPVLETPIAPIESVPTYEPAPFEAPPVAAEASLPSVEAHPMPEVSPAHLETPVPEHPAFERVEMPEQQQIPTVTAETPPDSMIEMQAPAPVINKDFIMNSFDVKVPVAEPHIYAGAGGKDLFVYGGSPAEKASAIFKYLTENPDKAVYSADDNGEHRILRRLVEVKGELKLVPDAPVRTSGFFGFFSSFMEAPKPDEFAKIIR